MDIPKRDGQRMFLNVKFIQITMSEVSTGQFFQKPLNFFSLGIS